MVLLLRNEDIVGLMGLSEYVDAVESGYRDVGNGTGVNLPRENLWIEGDSSKSMGGGHLKPGARASFKFKGALLQGLEYAGIQAYTAGLPGGLETFMFLFDTSTGKLSAIMEVLYYDWLKTAAVGAVATKYLAPENATRAAIFGTGRHARAQLHGLCAVRPIKTVLAYSRDRVRREAFCHMMSGELGIEVVPVSQPRDALDDVQIVTTITTSAEPVFDGSWLPDGPVHINAMGAHYPWAREIDEKVVLNSTIVLDHWDQGFKEQGEILIPMEKGLLDRAGVHADLAQVVSGRAQGRENGVNWTLFLSGGTGLEDVATAGRVCEVARAKGVGTEFEFGRPYEFRF